MTEQWFCLDCFTVGQLDSHGRCSSCQSEAVVSCETNNLKPATAKMEVA